MNTIENQGKAVLMLDDGTIFYGKAAGKIGTATGEICFNTGMTGYQEVFTDPSYFGQILLTTNAHIGNYGTLAADDESERVQIEGLICKNFTNKYSRSMADNDIQGYFEENQIVAIHNVDTRELVKKVRDKGAMNVIISSEEFDEKKLRSTLDKVPNMEGLELSSKVSTKEVYTAGEESAPYRVAILDFGVKRNIVKCFTDRGCYCKIFPAKTSFEEIQNFNPDGYFLSNGPGDPAAMDYAIATIKQITQQSKPTFGICLGHQLLALSVGITTYKMHNGHRGINHPVINLKTGKCEITTQNHGFGVNGDSVREFQDSVDVTHMNLNDDTIEGIKLKDKPAFSVQYHPEAAPGPHDSRYLFDQFVNSIKASK